MTKKGIERLIFTRNGVFQIVMAIMEDNKEIAEPFKELLKDQDQDKAKEIFEGLRKEEDKNNVVMGKMTVTTSGTVELVKTLKQLLKERN